jgi:archaellum component FlaG (FlaF/FlaG flagellin family)
MAAFGITFPKLRLCRSTTSKVDSNTVSTTTSPPATTTASTRTLSLSIKNVPSQPLHYDVSTTTVKKKPISMANILAIDGETKQLPKNLSVFNELQLDDGKINKHSQFSIRKTKTENILVRA